MRPLALHTSLSASVPQRNEESGQALVEYTLIIFLVFLACFGALVTFGTDLRDFLQATADVLFGDGG